ncbi:hypothetical protein CLV84_1187 [Neolewinella xylanilytica]|uniref:Uncharacterized protein n=1 Tax=Neolewinella xylanilytica TaxID=1514080 RepID=A0A2S6I9S1_9BACT|nr:hypothetical protein [Neolewinella xylanilytica]PPK88222.1 hypothetical protein CLV84_1187 [Neolewinella xylanilytica]
MLRTLYLLLSIPLLLLLSSSPAVPDDNPATPVITETTLPPFSHGTASGDNMMQFRGYTVSHVLSELTSLPVDYRLEEDPRIDFNYAYPDLSTEEATKVAIRALVEFVGGRVAGMFTTTPGYLLEASPTIGKRSAEDLGLSGTGKKVENNRVGASELSLSELAALLNAYRPEGFYAEDDACCVSVLFPADASLEALEQGLLETAGVRLRAGKPMVTGLRVTR